MSAVANKTEILQKVVQLIDDKTMLIVTADHGHVDVGGHYGVEDTVLSIPLLLYKKNSNLSTKQSNSVCVINSVHMVL